MPMGVCILLRLHMYLLFSHLCLLYNLDNSTLPPFTLIKCMRYKICVLRKVFRQFINSN